MSHQTWFARVGGVRFCDAALRFIFFAACIIVAAGFLSMLAACGTETAVVTRTETVLPAPPSPDLLTLPDVVSTLGSGNAKEALTRVSADNKELRRRLTGWIGWWRAAERSVEATKAGVKP